MEQGGTKQQKEAAAEAVAKAEAEHKAAADLAAASAEKADAEEKKAEDQKKSSLLGRSKVLVSLPRYLAIDLGISLSRFLAVEDNQ